MGQAIVIDADQNGGVIDWARLPGVPASLKVVSAAPGADDDDDIAIVVIRFNGSARAELRGGDTDARASAPEDPPRPRAARATRSRRHSGWRG